MLLISLVMGVVRSIKGINRLIECGDAIVLTAQEVCDMVQGGEEVTLKDVDVVTTATRAIMSGTYAVLSFSIASQGSFLRAKRAWINGVTAHVGPCPNERLGILDLMVFGTAHSRDRPEYGGGHLFRDLVQGSKVEVVAETVDGKMFSRSITLSDMPTAKMFSTRNSFKNYVAFVNTRNEEVSTIFNAQNFCKGLTCATVSGCGQINPLKCDPDLQTIGIGTRVLINGAQGFVMGTGTRSMISRPNLMGLADMHHMTPELMGGFLTSEGPECIGSWAVPVPVLNKFILESIKTLDSEIPMPIMDVNVRQTISRTNYADAWGSVDLEVSLEPGRCIGCNSCTAESSCPMKAVTVHGSRIQRDKDKCFNCGLCTSKCPGGAFKGKLGSISMDGKMIPILLRQSNRRRALKMAESLKQQILDGTFKITQMTEHL
jgi:putative methanogenesis marker 16 metalloprotein